MDPHGLWIVAGSPFYALGSTQAGGDPVLEASLTAHTVAVPHTGSTRTADTWGTPNVIRSTCFAR